MDFGTGIRIGAYELLDELGAGGMASLYLARRTGLGGFKGSFKKLLVVKRIFPDLARDPALLKSFLNEARLTGLMGHPNVVGACDAFEHEGIPCLVLEFVHGRVLSEVAMRATELGQAVPRPLAVQVVARALQGLGYAHRLTDAAGDPLGLVHRDVSPQNIMVGFDGQVRLFDFGIAAVAGQEQPPEGVLAGKHAYLSPEQAQGRQLDHRSDLFSMGVVLYELLTNTRLFKRKSKILSLKAIIDGEIPPPREVVPELPPELDAVLSKALAMDPADRYQDALDMARDLNGWLASEGHPGGLAPISDYMRELFHGEFEAERERHRKLLHLPSPESKMRGLLVHGQAAPPVLPGGQVPAASRASTLPLEDFDPFPELGSREEGDPKALGTGGMSPWKAALLGASITLLVVVAAALAILLMNPRLP